jgi:WD40 repeat protein
LKLWNFESGECVKTFKGHTSIINSVSFSKDDKFVISGSADCTLKLWNVQTGECVRTFEGHASQVNSVSFSKDDKFVISAGD